MGSILGYNEFTNFLGVDSPLFSAIVLFKNQTFPRVFGGFLERRVPGKNGEVTPRNLDELRTHKY